MVLRPRRNRSRRSDRRGTSETIWGLVLIAGAATAAGLLGYEYLSSPRREPVDTTSLCPLSGPEGVTVVLVDTTDDLPSQAQQEVLITLKDLVTELPSHYRLEIRVLDIPKAKSKAIFSKCNPGNGEGLSEWSDNPRLARLKWIDSFEKPAEVAVRESMRSAEAEQSPIMGAIQDIALSDFTSEAVRNVPKQLIVISDMLEYTSDYGQYPKQGDLSYQRYKLSPGYRKYTTDLHGARVTIDYIQRRNVGISTLKHADFWKEWILDNRGQVGAIHKLQGLG
jgi:hypothetical protein